MTAPLVIVIPSRGRPQAIAELHAAFEATTAGCSELVVALDLDDPTAAEYPRGLDGLRYVVGRRNGFAPRLSHEAVKEARSAFAVGSWGDDHRPRTRGWDDQILGALEDLGSGIAYGDDLLQGEALPTAAHLTSDIIETLGWMTPPGLAHLYVDNFWLDLGRDIDRIRYLPDVVIEHMHPAAGKAEWDDLVRNANTPEAYNADRVAYEAYKRDRMAVDVERLRALL